MPLAPTRRRFIQTSAALACASGLGIGAAAAKPLPFRYAYSAISWETNIEAIKVGQRLRCPASNAPVECGGTISTSRWR